MKIYLTIFALFLSTLPASAEGKTPLTEAITAYAVASALDNVETFVNLRNGATERNGVLRVLGRGSPTGTVLANASLDTLSIIGAKKLSDSGHPKLAFVGLVGATAFRLWVIDHNFKTYRMQMR